MIVKDNFLEEGYFRSIQQFVMNPHFPWGFQSEVANHGEIQHDHFYFLHLLYDQGEPKSSLYPELIPFYEMLEVKAFIRSRVMLYTNQGKQIIHERHVDKPYSHKASLLYLNTNNGFTEFDDGKRVESVENRLVTFDGSKEHSSSTCTDEKVRLVLAINYF